MLHQFITLVGHNPFFAELVERLRLLDQAGREVLPVFFRRDRHRFAFDRDDDQASGVRHLYANAFFDFGDGRWRWRASNNAGAFGRRRSLPRHKLRTEESGRVRVIVDAKHQLTRRRFQPRPAPDHLIESDGRFDVTEENYIPHVRHVDACRQQVNRRRDEVMPRPAFEVCDVIAAAALRRTLESVVVNGRAAILSTPSGVQIVQGNGYIVGTTIAHAKDNRFLFGRTRRDKLAEQILSHDAHALFYFDRILETTRRISLAYVFCA